MICTRCHGQTTNLKGTSTMPHDPQYPGSRASIDDELSRRWREESERYVSAINEFVRRGFREGWQNIEERDEPKDTRQPMARAVLDAIRRANESGDIDGYTSDFLVPTARSSKCWRRTAGVCRSSTPRRWADRVAHRRTV